VSENNKRVASDVIHAANTLQTAVKSHTTGVDLRPKVDNLNATLQEAAAVRLPKDAAGNSTINGLATKGLVNETLRQYGYAFGVANAKGGDNSGIAKASDPGSPGSVVNMSAYQCQSVGFTSTKHAIPGKISHPYKCHCYYKGDGSETCY
jgi:hypothetical protein